MAVALDSNVVIGFLDVSDALHESARAKVSELLEEGEALVASVVTLAEVLTGAELGHHNQGVVAGFFDDIISEVLQVDTPAAERAATLRGQSKSLRMPDSLILATADVHPGVDRIVCADERAAKIAGLSCEVELLSK